MTADQTNESRGLPKELTEHLIVHSSQDQTITTTKYFSLPYIKTLSEKITKILTRTNNNTKITYRNISAINNLFTNTKDTDEIE